MFAIGWGIDTTSADALDRLRAEFEDVYLRNQLAIAAMPESGSVSDFPGTFRTGLLNVGAMARRELGAYFVSPMGWVIATLIIPVVTLFGFLGPVLLALAVLAIRARVKR